MVRKFIVSYREYGATMNVVGSSVAKVEESLYFSDIMMMGQLKVPQLTCKTQYYDDHGTRIIVMWLEVHS